MHITVQQAPKLAHFFQNAEAIFKALQADPATALAEHGEAICAMVEVFEGREALVQPVDKVVARLADNLPDHLRRLTLYLDGRLTPALEKLVRTLNAARGEALAFQDKRPPADQRTGSSADRGHDQ